MKKANIVFVVLAMFISLPIFGQMRKAEKEFRLYRFSRAVPCYLKALKNSDQKVRAKATMRLGDSYRLMNDVHQAASWYSRAVEYKDVEPIVWFHLGQSLRSIGEYERARNAFETYSRLAPSDKRGEVFAAMSMLPLSWLADPPSYEVRNLGAINTRWSDFSPSRYKEGLLFISDRGEDLLVNRNFEWTGTSYLNVYYTEPKYYKDYWTAFTTPNIFSGKLNQSYHDGPVFVLPNDNKVYITRTTWAKARKDKENIMTRLLKIYSLNLSNGDKDLEPFAFNSEEYSVAHPTLTPDGKTIIFASDMPGGYGNMDLYISHMLDGRWSKPINLGANINTSENEVFPFLLNDSILYYSSSGLVGYGSLDIFYSIRKGENIWSVPENLKSPINSSYDDFGIFVQENGNTGLFSSSRSGGQGKDDIYSFRALPTPQPVKEPEIEIKPVVEVKLPENLLLSGFVKDKQTRLPIESSKVFILNTLTNQVKVLETDSRGNYKMLVPKGVPFLVKAMKENYIQDCLQLQSSDAPEVVNMPAPRDLLLDKLEVDKVFVLENIYYDFDKWNIRPDAAKELNKLVQIMNESPIRIELGSHTDSRGSDEYNMKLSQRRADAAVEYIISQGIQSQRLAAKGYGESRLTNRCANGIPCSDADHQANRRTEFKVISIDRNLKEQPSSVPTYKAGDEIDFRLLPANFFSNCGQ